MTDRTKRAITAFGVAPIAPSLFYWLYAASGPRGAWVPISVWQLIDLVFWTSLIVTLPMTLVAGLIPYLVINRHSKLRVWHVLAISGAVGTIVGVAADALLGSVALGLSAGVTFCLIWHRAADGQSPA